MVCGIALLIVAAAAVPQATVSQIFTLSAIPGDPSLRSQVVIIDRPLTMRRDSAGRIHLSLSGVVSAPGIVTISSPPGTIQVAVDMAYAVFRLPSTSVGPVPGSACDRETGGGMINDDIGNLYLCVSNPARNGFIWMRWSGGTVVP